MSSKMLSSIASGAACNQSPMYERAGAQATSAVQQMQGRLKKLRTLASALQESAEGEGARIVERDSESRG